METFDKIASFFAWTTFIIGVIMLIVVYTKSGSTFYAILAHFMAIQGIFLLVYNFLNAHY